MARRPVQVADDTHPHREEVLKRLARIRGHVEAVRAMVGDGRECHEVLQQVSAVMAALAKVRLVLIEDHLDHCILDLVDKESGKVQIRQMKEALRRF